MARPTKGCHRLRLAVGSLIGGYTPEPDCVKRRCCRSAALGSWGRGCPGVAAREGQSESDRAERQNARRGLELSFGCGLGRSGGDRCLRERNCKIFSSVRRELLDQAEMSGSVGACGVGPCVVAEPSLRVSVAEGNRKLWVLSGKPVCIPRGGAVDGLRLYTPECAEAQVRVTGGMSLNESRVREIRTLGLKSGVRKRSQGGDRRTGTGAMAAREPLPPPSSTSAPLFGFTSETP